MPTRFLRNFQDVFRTYKRKDKPRQRHFVSVMDRSIVNTKGLSNNSGENNCFLNSAVQVFWHLDAFRKNFNLLDHHACVEKSCIFCALKVIFTQFQFSEEKVLPPDALRQALATAFKGQKKFQLGRMDDAAECFENILTRIHFHLSNTSTDDDCALEHCISHQKFGMTVIEQVVCECGETSEPMPFVQFVYYVTANMIITLSQKNLRFGQLLRQAHSNTRNSCPALCGRQAEVERTLTSAPDIICIGLIWDSETQTAQHIKNFVTAIGTDLRVADLYDSVVDTTWSLTSEHKLVGMICYYGKHYSSLLYSKSNIWVSCDDATVTEMGPNWSDVIDKCHKGRYQPSLLLYQNRKATRLSTRSAPTKTMMVKSIGPNRHETGVNRSSPSKKSKYSDGNANNSSSSRDGSGWKLGSDSKGTTDSQGQSSVVTSSKPSTILPAEIQLKGPRYVTNTGHNSGHRDLLGSITLDPRRQHCNAGLQVESTYGQSGQPRVGYGVKYYTPAYPIPCQPQYTTVPNQSLYAAKYGGDVASTAAINGLHYQWTADGGPVMTDQRISSVNPVSSGHMVAMPSGPSPNLVYNTHPPSQSLSACNLLNDPTTRDVRLISGASSHHSDLSSGFQSNAGTETMENARRENRQELRVSAQMQASNGFEMLQVDAQGKPNIRTLPSDGSLSDWSLIDGSPDTTYDSTSSLYDNLPDFAVLSIDEKAGGHLTNSSDLCTSSLVNSLSMTSNNESYYFVPSTTQLNDIAADYKGRSDEADKLMELSQLKEDTGDIYAALICCNQAFSLYSVTRKEAANLGWSFIEEIEQKLDSAAFRSKQLHQQIQERSRAEKKHKSSARSLSDQSVVREPIQVARDLMNFEEESKHKFTPQYQALKDCLPHLYSQTLPQKHFRADK